MTLSSNWKWISKYKHGGFVGNELYNSVISETGLQNEGIEDEFSKLLQKHSLDPQNLTLEQLREVMTEYLQDVFVETLQKQKAI